MTIHTRECDPCSVQVALEQYRKFQASANFPKLLVFDTPTKGEQAARLVSERFIFTWEISAESTFCILAWNASLRFGSMRDKHLAKIEALASEEQEGTR